MAERDEPDGLAVELARALERQRSLGAEARRRDANNKGDTGVLPVEGSTSGSIAATREEVATDRIEALVLRVADLEDSVARLTAVVEGMNSGVASSPSRRVLDRLFR